MLFAIGALVMPAAFAALPAADAGRDGCRRVRRARRRLSLALAAVLLLSWRAARRAAAAAGGRGSLASAEVLLVFGALFCTVAGYFALQPMMAAGARGPGRAGRSARCMPPQLGFFALKSLLVLALAWRLTRR